MLTLHVEIGAQPAFTCSNLTIKTLEQRVKLFYRILNKTEFNPIARSSDKFYFFSCNLIQLQDHAKGAKRRRPFNNEEILLNG